jgi:NitT/TauT family transport system permease protein
LQANALNVTVGGEMAVPKWIYPAASVLALLLIWHVVVVAFSIAPYLVPRPLPVFEYIATSAGFLLFHASITTYETLGGFLLSLVIGVPLAMLLVWSRSLEQAVMPLLVLSETFPKVALAPLFIIWFGFGIQTKVLISFLIAFFPVVVSTIVGMRSVENDMIDLARSLNASAHRIFFHIRLPHALPSILSGMKVAIAFAVVGAVVSSLLTLSDD